MAFFCVFLLQCLQMDADSDHQRSGNHGEDRGTDKSNDRMKFKNRRKVLRLNSPAPPNGGSDESDGHDSDYVPSSPVQAGIAAEGSNRKRRRKQARRHAPADAAAAPRGVVGGQDVPKRRPVSIRCSPMKFKEIVAALGDTLKGQVVAKNFGGLLQFKPHELDRHLLSWLMRKLNPETMKLEIGGGKEIAITEHSVWCVFQIPNAGSDPPHMTDDEARIIRRELGLQICGNAYNPRRGFSAGDILDGLNKKTLRGSLGLRAFFMCAFQSLLFSNTDAYIRLEDVKYTEDLENIGNRNWCKAVVDHLRKAARLYRKDFPEKGIMAPISGCGIFLMVSVFPIFFLLSFFFCFLCNCVHLLIMLQSEYLSCCNHSRYDVATRVAIMFCAHLAFYNVCVCN